MKEGQNLLASRDRRHHKASICATRDADGNTTYDTVHHYTWDTDGNMIGVDGSTSVTYDAFDRVAEIANGGHTQVVYGPGSGKLALMSGQTLEKAFVPLAGGTEAVYTSSGLAYYRHSDWLGSSRLASTTSRAVYYDGAYAPYGENYAETGTNDHKFAGMEQDIVSSGPYPLYDALMREYHPTWGRWLSPDPAGMAAASPANPQSWNMYAYVGNNPLSFIDPLGMQRCPAGEICVTSWGNAPDDGPGSGLGDLWGGGGTDSGFSDLEVLGRGPHWPGGGGITPLPLSGPTPQEVAEFMPMPCQAGPLNLGEDIRTAKSLAGQFWSGLFSAPPAGDISATAAASAYVSLVQTGGPWDPKTTLGPTPANVAAGNINFGATCSQFGFNSWLGGQICQFGAGIYGKLTGNYGSPIFSRYHGDWPSDNMQIRQGLAIAKKGGC